MNTPTNSNTGPGYCVLLGNDIANYLATGLSEKYSRMKAFCDLMDKAVANSDAQPGSPADKPFVVTITELADRWHWHRATVRSFLDQLVTAGYLHKQPLTKSYLITLHHVTLSPNPGL